MRNLKIALLSIVGLLVLLAVVGSFLPSKWQVERSIVIHATPEKIYPFVANLKMGWPQWSAFDASDPEIVYTYAGPEEGTDSIRSWTSKKMGDGFQKITHADATGIHYDLEMIHTGMKLQAKIVFTPVENGTQVTWTDNGENSSIIHRYMALGIDKMMGPTFETSLAKLKELTEEPVVALAEEVVAIEGELKEENTKESAVASETETAVSEAETTTPAPEAGSVPVAQTPAPVVE